MTEFQTENLWCLDRETWKMWYEFWVKFLRQLIDYILNIYHRLIIQKHMLFVSQTEIEMEGNGNKILVIGLEWEINVRHHGTGSVNGDGQEWECCKPLPHISTAQWCNNVMLWLRCGLNSAMRTCGREVSRKLVLHRWSLRLLLLLLSPKADNCSANERVNAARWYYEQRCCSFASCSRRRSVSHFPRPWQCNINDL